MTPLHQMSKEQLLLHFAKVVYFLLSTSASYLAVFHASKERRGRWLIQVYGVLSSVLTVILCRSSQRVSEWRVFRRRQGWIVKSAVGVFMLGFSTLVAVMRAKANSLSGVEVQLLLVATGFLHLQLIGPSTEFGIINFGLRIPILTTYLVYGFEKWPLYVVGLGMICCTIFQEFFAGMRERKLREANIQKEDDEKTRLRRKNTALEKENLRLKKSLDDAERNYVWMQTRAEELTKEKEKADKMYNQLLKFNRRY